MSFEMPKYFHPNFDEARFVNAPDVSIEIAEIYDFKTIECNIGNEPKKIEEINEELYEYVYKFLNI